MEAKDKVAMFSEELGRIKTNDIKKWTEWAIAQLPDYFFEVPASSGGRYHPKYALGSQGLVRHTKAAARIAITLLGIEMFSKYSEAEQSAIVAALILHDGLKSGLPKQKYTIVDHPVKVCEYLHDTWEAIEDKASISDISGVEIRGILSLIHSHMGQWNTDRAGVVKMPKPKTPAQKFVHLCDYLASRKTLEFNFEAQF